MTSQIRPKTLCQVGVDRTRLLLFCSNTDGDSKRLYEKIRLLTVYLKCDHLADSRSDAVAGLTQVVTSVHFANLLERKGSVLENLTAISGHHLPEIGCLRTWKKHGGCALKTRHC